MAEIVLDAKSRESSTNKGTKKRMRKEGIIPGIFYAEGNAAVAISVDELELRPLVFTADNHVVNLKIDGKDTTNCIIKNVQFDPLTDKIIHFDLLGLKAGHSLQLQVPVLFEGQPIGVKTSGGLLQQTLNKLDIECLPRHIPANLPIDVSNLEIGDAIYVRDLSFENIEILNAENAVVVSVTQPRAEEEIAEDEELIETDETVEPEVISKGKSEEEEE